MGCGSRAHFPRPARQHGSSRAQAAQGGDALRDERGPPELVARDPQVAGVLYYAAKGYAAHHGLDEPIPPARAPILSEASGGGRPAAPALTSFDQAIRKAMQVSEKAYSETGSRFKPGAINVLED